MHSLVTTWGNSRLKINWKILQIFSWVVSPIKFTTWLHQCCCTPKYNPSKTTWAPVVGKFSVSSAGTSHCQSRYKKKQNQEDIGTPRRTGSCTSLIVKSHLCNHLQNWCYKGQKMWLDLYLQPALSLPLISSEWNNIYFHTQFLFNSPKLI